MTHNGWPKAMFCDSTDLSALHGQENINLMVKSRAARLDNRRLLFIRNKMKEKVI